MKKITIGMKIVLGFLLALGIAVFICQRQNGHEIQSAAYLASQDGILYGIDMTDDDYYLFRTEISTGYSQTVRVSRREYGGTVNISGLAVGTDGRLYFFYEKESEDRQQWIGTCDFSRETIQKLFDFHEITDEMFWTMYSGEGRVILVTYDQTAAGSAHMWLLDQESMEWEDRGVYSIQNQVESILADGDALWCLDSLGNISVATTESEETLVFANDGSQIGTANCMHQLLDGTLHFLNLDSGNNYVLKWENGEGELSLCDTCVDYETLKEQFGYISDVGLLEDGQAIGYTWADEKRVPFVYGENSFVLLRLLDSPKDQAMETLVLAVQIFVVFLIVFFVISFIFWLHKGVFPLLTQMLLIVLPLFAAVCLLSSEMLNQILVDRLLETEAENLVQETVLYKNSVRASGSFLPRMQENDGEQDTYLPRSSYFDQTDGKKKQEPDIFYIYAYVYRDEEFYDVSNGSSGLIPLPYTVGKDIYDALHKSLELYDQMQQLQDHYKSTSQIAPDITWNMVMPVTLRHQDLSGSWLSAFAPYYDSKSDTMMVIELREDIQAAMIRISQPVNQATRAIFLGFGVLAAAVFFIVFLSLMPLRGVTRGVNEISRGKLDIQIKESLRFTEIGRISHIFNQMSFNISRTMKELTSIGKKYAMFIPVQFLGYLGRESILETEHGDFAEEEFVVMEISSSDFAAVSGTITGRETFEVINEALERMIPVLEQHEGMVTHFINAGALSIYKDNGNQALSAAVSVLQAMNRKRLQAGDTPITYTAGICFGPVRLGIIGAGQRLEAAAMSLNCQFAGMLQRMAVEYGAGILMTGDAAKRVKNFESDYHFRTLGYVLFSSKDAVDVIYDVYDGDDVDERQLKENTKELFETGVRLYAAAQFMEARSCFVQVLFENRNDLAARQYFSFCEKFLNGESDGMDCHYIDVF